MLSHSNRFHIPLVLLAVLGLLMASACGQSTALPPTTAPAAHTPADTAAPAAAPTATVAAAAASPTHPVAQAPAPTSTTAPTQTPPPATDTPQPTSTPAPTFGAAETGLAGWCIEPDAMPPSPLDPANPPAGARIGKAVENAFEIGNLPSNGCVFMYTFNQPAPAGLKLAVYELKQKTPWLTADLAPVDGQPNSVAVLLRHTYIMAPPVWKISYQFAVQDATGKELRRDQVNLNRWVPKLCWNGLPPDLKRLRCPLAEDLHPWDPSYGTPIPTFIPTDDY